MKHSVRAMIVSLAFMFCGMIGISWYFLNYAIAYSSMELYISDVELFLPVTFCFMLYGGIFGALLSLIKD